LVVVMDFCWRKNNTPQSARRAFNLHPILDKSDLDTKNQENLIDKK
jgi:hypothetical protein